MGYRWYFGFKVHNDGTITVIVYDRIHCLEQGHPLSMGECQPIEGPGRVLESLVINTKEYKVNNPKHAFEYNKFDGSNDENR